MKWKDSSLSLVVHVFMVEPNKQCKVVDNSKLELRELGYEVLSLPFHRQ